MQRFLALTIPACIFLSAFCVADTITIDGITHDGVYVRESDSRYYIQIPSTGQTLSAPKSSVDASQVLITKDHSERDALLREWRIKNAVDTAALPRGTGNSLASHGSSNIHPDEETVDKWVSVEPQADLRLNHSSRMESHGAMAVLPVVPLQAQRTASPLDASKATDGYVQRIKVDNMKLKEALDALLRPLNLDYEVRDGYIWISTAEKLRTESFEGLEVRTFQLNHAGAEVLPKVGVSNLGGLGGTVSGGMGYGGGYGNSYREANRGGYSGAYRGR